MFFHYIWLINVYMDTLAGNVWFSKLDAIITQLMGCSSMSKWVLDSMIHHLPSIEVLDVENITSLSWMICWYLKNHEGTYT